MSAAIFGDVFCEANSWLTPIDVIEYVYCPRFIYFGFSDFNVYRLLCYCIV